MEASGGSSKSMEFEAMEDGIAKNEVPPMTLSCHEELIDDDPMMCREYSEDILSYLREKEKVFMCNYKYMEEVQQVISAKMRAILVDWLVEVTEEYQLNPETLFLAVNYLDRFLSKTSVAKTKLQLVGITCLFIASKYEEICPPPLDEFVFITANTYSRSEIISTERYILTQLNYQVTVPTSKGFLKRLLKQVPPHCMEQMLARYLLDMSLGQYDLTRYFPSQLAAASLSLAFRCLSGYVWNETWEALSGYREIELHEIERQLFQVYKNMTISDLNALERKYGHARFLKVSSLAIPDVFP